MDIEPSSLSFREIRINQTYSASICISNTYQTPIEFQLIPSHQRYTIIPNKVTLYPKQSIVITVKLFANQKKIDLSIEDSIRVKSDFSEQRIPIELHFKDNNNNNDSNNNSLILLEKQRQEFEQKSEKVHLIFEML